MHRLVEQSAGGDQIKQLAVDLLAGNLPPKTGAEQIKDVRMVGDVAGVAPKLAGIRWLDLLALACQLLALLADDLVQGADADLELLGRLFTLLLVTQLGQLDELGNALLVLAQLLRGVRLIEAKRLAQYPIFLFGEFAHSHGGSPFSHTIRFLICSLAAASHLASRSLLFGSCSAARPRSRIEYITASIVLCGVG